MCAAHIGEDGNVRDLYQWKRRAKQQNQPLGDLLDLISDELIPTTAAVAQPSLSFTTLSHSSYPIFTGITYEQFNELLQCISFREGDVFCKRDSLGLYLMRMRTGWHAQFILLSVSYPVFPLIRMDFKGNWCTFWERTLPNWESHSVHSGIAC